MVKDTNLLRNSLQQLKKQRYLRSKGMNTTESTENPIDQSNGTLYDGSSRGIEAPNGIKTLYNGAMG